MPPRLRNGSFPLNRDLWGAPFKRRARVSGVLTYKLDGSVMSIDTRKVIMPPEKMPPPFLPLRHFEDLAKEHFFFAISYSAFFLC